MKKLQHINVTSRNTHLPQGLTCSVSYETVVFMIVSETKQHQSPILRVVESDAVLKTVLGSIHTKCLMKISYGTLQLLL